jgi:hypothetical protein
MLIASPAGAQDLSGRWVYAEGQQTAELVLRHDLTSGRVSGTFSLLGLELQIEGRVNGAALTIESMGGTSLGSQGRTMSGRLQQDKLMVRIVNPGEDPVTMPMRRDGGKPLAQSAAPRANAPATADFGGRWESSNDDKTSLEVLEITITGSNLEGTARELERGYFSGRVNVKRTFRLRGTIQGAKAVVRVWDVQGSESAGGNATIERRGAYLIIRFGNRESPYARPGAPLVQSAEGSAEAARLAQSVAGRVYQTVTQAGGRGGFAGGRMKVAFCSDGRMEYDASNLASTGASPAQTFDMGSTVTRRGVWRVVLRGGKAVVRAEWQGTGSSYSLTDYFEVSTGQDGRSATINGVDLPSTGGC